MRRAACQSGVAARRTRQSAALLGHWRRPSRSFGQLAAPVQQPAAPPRKAEAAPAAAGVKAEEGVAGTTPEFLDLQSLVRRLSRELPAAPQRGEPIDEAVVERVSALLRQTRLNPREWRQHAVFRRGRYTRNIVGYSPGQFVALLLCWERGQQSPIHDHSGAHCFIKMLGGTLREERFAWEASGGAGAEVLEDGMLSAAKASSSVGFMHDSKGLHRISNPSTEEAAVSLHIYSPPFSDCLVFPPTGAEPRRAPMVSVNLPSASERAPPTPALSLRGLCTSLAQLPEGNADAAAFDLATAVELNPMEWAMYASPAHFSEFHCVQNLVHIDDRFSVVVSCWSPGQSVPPHMVGRGRRTWIKVVCGNLQWQLFSPSLFPWESDVERQSLMPEGSASEVKECAVKLHNFKNASETEIAVSVQVFSPPLTQFAFQTKDGIERQDLPSLLADLEPTSAPSQVNGHHPAQVNGVDSSAHPGEAAAVAKAPAVGAGLRGLERTAGRRYLSFQDLAGLLDEEFQRPDPSNEAVSALLKKAVFNPEEWRTCLGRAFLSSKWSLKDMSKPQAKPQRVLVAQRRSYTLLLSFWSQGDEREELQHPWTLTEGRSWTLMLEGELEEQVLSREGLALHSCVLKEDGLSFRIDRQEDGLRVRRRCDADVPCVSLHLYTPARVVDSTAAP